MSRLTLKDINEVLNKDGINMRRDIYKYIFEGDNIDPTVKNKYYNTVGSKTLDEWVAIGRKVCPKLEEAVVASNIPSTPTGNFGGSPFFDVDSDVYQNCLKGKNRYHKWETYLGNNEEASAIKNYVKSNLKQKVMIRNRQTKNLIFIRNPGFKTI